jgi:hypothetical protein
MWAQKGIATLIEHYLSAHSGVDLSTQQAINRELAGRASVDGSLATIDLKEASNRIPWSLVQELLGSHPLLDLISMARVQKTLLPWDEYIELQMCSTMGNGFTFVLQTAIFYSVVRTALEFSGYPCHRQPYLASASSASKNALRWSQTSGSDELDVSSFITQGTLLGSDLSDVSLPSWGVFGDDLIVPVKCVPDTFYLIEEVIGGKVNTEKSFILGDFRESCGADWFCGSNVRPIYAKSLKTPQDRLSLLNRLVAWSGFQRIPLPRTCKALWASIPEKFLVPISEADTAGLKVPESLAPKFPRPESVVKMEYDYQRRARGYPCYVPKPEIVTFQGCQIAIYGPGLLLAMLKGEVTSSIASTIVESAIERKVRSPNLYSLMVRARNLTYGVRWKVTFDWDLPISPMYYLLDHEWSLLCNLNLYSYKATR